MVQEPPGPSRPRPRALGAGVREPPKLRGAGLVTQEQKGTQGLGLEAPGGSWTGGPRRGAALAATPLNGNGRSEARQRIRPLQRHFDGGSGSQSGTFEGGSGRRSGISMEDLLRPSEPGALEAPGARANPYYQ